MLVAVYEEWYRKSFKAPLKNNYDPQRPCSERKKNYFGPLGAPCLERHLRIRAQLRPFQSDLIGRATTGRGEGVGCRLGLRYALIVAAVVSEVENYSTAVDEPVV